MTDDGGIRPRLRRASDQPWWVAALERYGIWAFLVLFLLGAIPIPGFRGPLERLVQAVHAERQQMTTKVDALIESQAQLNRTQMDLLNTQKELLNLRRDCLGRSGAGG